MLCTQGTAGGIEQLLRDLHLLGADAILVGKALMRAGDRTAKIAELKGVETA